MEKEFIKTLYKPNKNSEEIEQWWLAYLNDKNYLTVSNLSNFTGGYKTYLINDYMKKLDTMTIANISFVPITAPNEKAKESREFYRGSEYDDNPMIYRKTSIPEVIYRYQRFCAYSLSNLITDGMRSQLNTWFKSQLEEHCNNELLKYLVEQERKDFFNRLEKQFIEHINETKKIMGFIKGVEDSY